MRATANRHEGLAAAAARVRLAVAVGVGNAKTGEDAALLRLHHLGIVVGLVIIPEKMQKAMNC